jgi:hypothetical protein
MEVKGVAKNPLAIIALFISFMYGSASLILGTAVGKLDPSDQRALVIFLVSFPLLILFSFLFLVVFHHRKLYAPGDYRSDESFLAGVQTVTGAKAIEDETDGDEAEPAAHAELTGDDQNVLPMPESAAPPANGNTFGQNLRLAESLVADLFQKRYGGLLKRDVQFVSKTGRKFVFDFAIEVKDTVYIGDVKYTRYPPSMNLLNSMLGRFYQFDAVHIADGVRFIKLAVVVVENRPGIARALSSDTSRRIRELKGELTSADLIIEGFTMTELLQGEGPTLDD